MTKIDELYNLHATLGHMPYSRIERMILKGLYNGYSFDMSLLKHLVNVINEAGEIIITLKHGDTKVLITPDHSIYARLKAIIDSGASVRIFNQRTFFSDFTEQPIKIRTAGTPIMTEGYRTVGKLQNCLLVKDLHKNLISVSHVCRDMNAYFVTDNV